MDKRKKKFLRKELSWIFLKIFTFLCDKCSLSLLYIIGAFLGRIAYTVVLPHKKVALESLSIAFPDFSLKKRKKIAKEFFIFMAQSFFELIYFLKKPHLLEEEVKTEGENFLKKALGKNKGVILLTAHLGNFPLISLVLAKKGYRINVVARPMRDEKIDIFVNNLRNKAGIKTILSYPRKECVESILRALRNNEIVMIQMDQNFGTGGVWVKFFNKLAATPVGPVIFALRTKAAIVPAYIKKDEDKYLIRFLPEEPLDYFPNREEMVLKNVAKFTRIIESWIRENPSYWSWNHRRWKSRPSESVLRAKFKVQKD